MADQEDDIKAADIDSGINIANERFDFSSPKSRNVEINLHLHRSISKQLESPSKLSSLTQPRFDPFSWWDSEIQNWFSFYDTLLEG